MQWHFGSFRLDLANACLWPAVQSVTLRPKTFEVLVYLVTRTGQLVTKEALFDAIWPETVVGDGVLKISMTELRKALGETAKAPQARTGLSHTISLCLLRAMAQSGSGTRDAASLQRPLPPWQQLQSDGGRQSCIVFRVNCFCQRQAASSRRRRHQTRVSVRRLRGRASSRRRPWSCEPP